MSNVKRGHRLIGVSSKRYNIVQGRTGVEGRGSLKAKVVRTSYAYGPVSDKESKGAKENKEKGEGFMKKNEPLHYGTT